MHRFAIHSNEATTGTRRTILGVVGCAVNSQGSTILSHAAGSTHLDEATARPIDANAAFPLASSTKLITAIAALRLVEQGKLDLDDATVVEEHLPELCQQPIITAHSPECTFEPRKHGITVRHLMTHTSGSSFDLIDPTLRAWRASRNEPPISLTAPLPQALEMPGVFQPGEGWRYGGGLDWTGLLISRLTGMTLGEFMRKEIFDVVGCDDNIGFSRTEIEKGGIVVQCATVTPAGELEAHHNPDMPSERGGGGLFASAANYIKILGDLIALKPMLLKPGSVDLLFTPQLSTNQKALNDLRNSGRIFGAMTGPLTASLSPTGMDHALGGLLIMEDNEKLGKTKGTMTWGGAFSSLWFVNRERGIAAFYGSSMFPPAQGVTKDLMGEFVSEVWGEG